MALWRSTVIVSAMTMLSRVLGLVRDIVLLNVFGAGKDFDTFVVAFRIPNFFRRLFAEGAFSQAFIPVLTEYKTGRTHAEVQILISRVFGCLMTVMTALTFIAMVAAPAVLYIRTRFPCRSREVRPRGFNVPPHHSLFIVYVVDGICQQYFK